MARDRTASSLNPYLEDTLFVGQRVPDTIRHMVKQLTNLDKASFKKILHGKLEWFITFMGYLVLTITVSLLLLGPTLHSLTTEYPTTNGNIFLRIHCS